MEIRVVDILDADKLVTKHGVWSYEVEQVLLSASTRFFYAERGRIEGEDVYRALGQTVEGRYLVVFFIQKRDRRALVLSARATMPKERRDMKRSKTERDSLPDQFETVEELISFWDTHDSEDYPTAWREVQVKVDAKNHKYPRVVLEPEVVKQLNKRAREEGVPLSDLINRLLKEQLGLKAS